jgi:hypothetical protein
MSYFCENKKLDLSGKMIEELNLIQKELIITPFYISNADFYIV